MTWARDETKQPHRVFFWKGQKTVTDLGLHTSGLVPTYESPGQQQWQKPPSSSNAPRPLHLTYAFEEEGSCLLSAGRETLREYSRWEPQDGLSLPWSLAPPSGASQHCLEPRATCSRQGQRELDAITPCIWLPGGTWRMERQDVDWGRRQPGMERSSHMASAGGHSDTPAMQRGPWGWSRAEPVSTTGMKGS